MLLWVAEIVTMSLWPSIIQWFFLSPSSDHRCRSVHGGAIATMHDTTTGVLATKMGTKKMYTGYLNTNFLRYLPNISTGKYPMICRKPSFLLHFWHMSRQISLLQLGLETPMIFLHFRGDHPVTKCNFP